MSEEELREYSKEASLEISNMQHTIDKQKEVIDKIKEYMKTLSDEYATDDYDIKCEVFNKIYYELLEEIK